MHPASKKFYPMVIFVIALAAVLMKCDVTTGTEEPVTETLNGDNSLKSLVLSGNGSWDREFNQEVLEYTYTVINTVESISLTPGANSGMSQITINGGVSGSDNASSPVPLVVGNNQIVIQVTAQNGAVRQYSVNVVRLAPDVKGNNNAALASLTLSGASLVPAFNPETLAYTVSVSDAQLPLSASATAKSAGATVSYSLDGAAIANPSAINIPGAAATLTVVVTAADGTTKRIYAIAITKSSVPAVSNDATLVSLAISGVTLVPAFNSETLAYTASVPAANIPLNVSAAAKSAGATVSYSLDGVAVANPSAIDIPGATASLAVMVTAADGATKRTYTIAVTKVASPAVSNDAALASLAISGASLVPAFNPETLAYTASVPAANVPLNVSTAAKSAGAAVSYSLDGVAVANPSAISIPGAAATLAVVVTAADGRTKKTYTVAITKAAAPSTSSASLKGIELTFGAKNSRRPLYLSFNEPTKTTFDSAIVNYAAVVYATNSVTLKATASDPTVTSIVFNGGGDGAHTGGVKTGSIPLTAGIGKVTTATITVTGKDGSTVKKYTVAIKLLNADEFFWGIYALHYIKSYHRWRDTVPNPGPGLQKTIKGFISGALDWNITLSGLRGKNHMKLTNYNDGNDDQGSTPIHTPYLDNTGENKEDGFVVNSDLIGDLSLFGNGTQTGTMELSTPWGDKIASIDVNYVVKSKQIAIDPNSYSTLTYMGEKRRFNYLGGADKYPYPFKTGYDWNTPWVAEK